MTFINDGYMVKIGNDSSQSICGFGVVSLNFTSINLFGVLFIPKLHKNLVSGDGLNSNGFKQNYKSSRYNISRFGTFIGFG